MRCGRCRHKAACPRRHHPKRSMCLLAGSILAPADLWSRTWAKPAQIPGSQHRSVFVCVAEVRAVCRPRADTGVVCQICRCRQRLAWMRPGSDDFGRHRSECNQFLPNKLPQRSARPSRLRVGQPRVLNMRSHENSGQRHFPTYVIRSGSLVATTWRRWFRAAAPTLTSSQMLGAFQKAATAPMRKLEHAMCLFSLKACVGVSDIPAVQRPAPRRAIEQVHASDQRQLVLGKAACLLPFRLKQDRISRGSRLEERWPCSYISGQVRRIFRRILSALVLRACALAASSLCTCRPLVMPPPIR